MEELEAVLDPGVADWIAPRLGGGFGTVRRFVPAGFAAHARILHPVDPAPLTWADVCARSGRVPHALMQWELISVPGGDVEVRTGNLAVEALARLLQVLAPFTGDQDCVHAVWAGYGWFSAVPLELPQREYAAFRGPLRAAATLGEQVSDDWFVPQSPNLLWPSDRTWFVATEIDLDSTLIGGPAELVEELLATPGLEVWPIGAGDDLSSTGDRVNAP